MKIEERSFREHLSIPTVEGVTDTVELLHAAETNRTAFSAELEQAPRLSIDWDVWKEYALSPTPFEKIHQTPIHLLGRAVLTFSLPIITTTVCIMLFSTAIRAGSAMWWITAVGVGMMALLMNFLSVGFFFLGGSLSELQASLKKDPFFGFRSRMVVVPVLTSILVLIGTLGTTLYLNRTSDELDPQLLVDLDSMRVMSRQDASELRDFLFAERESGKDADEKLSPNVRGMLAESAGNIEFACELYEVAVKQGYEPALMNFNLCKAEFLSHEMASADHELTSPMNTAEGHADGDSDDPREE